MECCGGNAAGLESQMSKPDAPAPPDFTGAAQATGQSNITAAIINRLMQNQGANTPWGSLAFNQTGTTHIGPGGVSTGGMPSGAPTGAPVQTIPGANPSALPGAGWVQDPATGHWRPNKGQNKAAFNG